MISKPDDIIREDVQDIWVELEEQGRRFAGGTVLISGGAGFLGSYFVDTFLFPNDHGLQPPCRVIVLDNYSSSKPSNLRHLHNREDVQIYKADIGDALSSLPRGTCGSAHGPP